jgi:hypothetical protein
VACKSLWLTAQVVENVISKQSRCVWIGSTFHVLCIDYTEM